MASYMSKDQEDFGFSVHDPFKGVMSTFILLKEYTGEFFKWELIG